MRIDPPCPHPHGRTGRRAAPASMQTDSVMLLLAHVQGQRVKVNIAHMHCKQHASYVATRMSGKRDCMHVDSTLLRHGRMHLVTGLSLSMVSECLASRTLTPMVFAMSLLTSKLTLMKITSSCRSPTSLHIYVLQMHRETVNWYAHRRCYQRKEINCAMLQTSQHLTQHLPVKLCCAEHDEWVHVLSGEIQSRWPKAVTGPDRAFECTTFECALPRMHAKAIMA